MAQEDIQRDQALSFGRFVLKDNNSARVIIQVTPAGVVTNDPAVLPFTSAQNGIFQLLDFEKDKDLTVNLTPSPMTVSTGAGPVFTVNFTTSPAVPHTDPVTGNATLYIGGTLSTSGTGVMYPNGTFSNDVTLSIMVNN